MKPDVRVENGRSKTSKQFYNSDLRAKRLTALTKGLNSVTFHLLHEVKRKIKEAIRFQESFQFKMKVSAVNAQININGSEPRSLYR